MAVFEVADGYRVSVAQFGEHPRITYTVIHPANKLESRQVCTVTQVVKGVGADGEMWVVETKDYTPGRRAHASLASAHNEAWDLVCESSRRRRARDEEAAAEAAEIAFKQSRGAGLVAAFIAGLEGAVDEGRHGQ